ncbi:MAG: GIY-YIG nuclease family protein [Solirubrobacteraceae bacterium]
MTVEQLKQPVRLWSRDEVIGSKPSPVPKAPGVYAWYFKAIPGTVDASDCHTFEGMPLLYVGIAPKKPYADGRLSRSTPHQRVRYHYRGNAEGSTLRLTLGCLLASTLGIELRRVGSGARRTFGEGEATLSRWMSENAYVTWIESAEPWADEHALIADLDLPLNLDQNRRNRFHAELTAIRKAAKQRAADLPILPR